MRLFFSLGGIPGYRDIELPQGVSSRTTVVPIFVIGTPSNTEKEKKEVNN
jgi:hypothetical protein